MAKENLEIIIKDFVDYLLPELTPYETSFYLYLLRNSFLKNGSDRIRIGKRTIAAQGVKGVRGNRANYAHVTETLKNLEKKGCLKVGDANREGTLYILLLPCEIPMVKEKIATATPETMEDNWFNDPEKRKELFERDKWTCYYCGEKITIENATLDHYVPQSKAGKHSKENLKSCCLLCNGIKSGKNYEEAAPFLLKSIRERKTRKA